VYHGDFCALAFNISVCDVSLVAAPDHTIRRDILESRILTGALHFNAFPCCSALLL
jgi:hypothetical protein